MAASQEKILNSLCICGHLQTHHLGLPIAEPPCALVDPHAGSCTRCSCDRFTWKSFVHPGEPNHATR